MTVGAEQGEIAEVGSPVLIAADPIDAQRPWRWTTTVIVVATAFLAVCNAGTAVAWLDELTPRPAVERLRGPMEGWSRATTALGLATGRAHLRDWWRRAREARFGNEQAGEPGAG